MRAEGWEGWRSGRWGGSEMAAGEVVAPVKVQSMHFSITPPSRANPASPRAREIAAAIAGGGGLLEKKELETLRSDADDSPSEPDNQPLHLELHVSTTSLCSTHSARRRVACPAATAGGPA